MSEKAETKIPQKSRSLAATLAITFVTLTTITLLVVSGVELYFNIRSEQGIVAAQHRFTALEAANTVGGFVQGRFGDLESVVKLGNLFDSSPVIVEQTLEKLLGFGSAFRQVAFLDTQGKVLAQASRLSQAAENELANRLEAEALAQTELGQRYISPVYIDDVTFEPLIAIAVPATNIFGDFQGTLVAEVNLKFMWDLVGQLEVGEEGTAYVVDRQGNLLAFEDITRVLANENLSHLEEVAEFVEQEDVALELEESEIPISTGINGTQVLANYVPLGTPDWAVVTEVPVVEAYYDRVIESALTFAVITLFAGLFVGVAGAYLARRLAAPVQNLTDTASAVAAGDIKLQAVAEGPAEVRQLAAAFNRMTAQLNDLIQSLEDRVTTRTQRLETVAVLSERLAAILEVDQLLSELVNQIKESFGYYHAHVYLVDEGAERLVMTAGAGEAGVQMKAQGHSIGLDAPTSLVARAAGTKEVVWVDNVRETKDWLPNPLLPDTFAEMALPIILDGQVVGVLDVQQDKISGLDESDASLLRSLANQAAVALRNARLFAEVETALTEAQALQEHYVAQAWQTTRLRGRKYHYHRSGAPVLDEMAKADGDSSTFVAPIKVQNQVIGDLQLYETDTSRRRPLTDQELAFVQAVVDQVAQTVENLRLFDEIRQQAHQEQSIREITNKLRAAPNLDLLLETAARELGQRLNVKHTIMELGIE